MGRLARAGALLLALILLGVAGLAPAGAERPNGAGLVIRHGDGTLIYVYVQFEGESVTGEDLFLNSGLPLTLAPYSGLGTGVCAIDGEGCPSDDCWCKSYSSPAYFWHYYALVDGAWVEQIIGPSSRTLSDGDVDGWSWTAGDPGLPSVSIDEIALMNGVDRDAADATATPTATEPPTPTPTEIPPSPTPEPTETATASVPTPTSTATAVAAVQATAASGVTATVRQEPSVTATPSVVAPATATATGVPMTPPATLPAGAPTPRPTTLAVVVNPAGTVTTIEPLNTDSGSSKTSYLLFGGFAALAVAAGAFVAVRGRRT